MGHVHRVLPDHYVRVVADRAVLSPLGADANGSADDYSIPVGWLLAIGAESLPAPLRVR